MAFLGPIPSILVQTSTSHAHSFNRDPFRGAKANSSLILLSQCHYKSFREKYSFDTSKAREVMSLTLCTSTRPIRISDVGKLSQVSRYRHFVKRKNKAEAPINVDQGQSSVPRKVGGWQDDWICLGHRLRAAAHQ
ncbi:hypothetical protein ACH5RR_001477 [Cinchona calisaya]|uniref:Uncharacterized protein n=1 Tax=Cinchona calisaya TaxID=153742 RepID=A0ABD3B3S3_9GENT